MGQLLGKVDHLLEDPRGAHRIDWLGRPADAQLAARGVCDAREHIDPRLAAMALVGIEHRAGHAGPAGELGLTEAAFLSCLANQIASQPPNVIHP